MPADCASHYRSLSSFLTSEQVKKVIGVTLYLIAFKTLVNVF
ncbi:hypothetical protein [Thermococcus siculi]|nr:hypothetical protein [Thermococcus siculi]